MNAVTLVLHDTDEPALFGAAAAAIAVRSSGTVWWTACSWPSGTHPDAAQHVFRTGALAPSGLVWAVRLTGQDALSLRVDEVPQPGAVIALHPAWSVTDPSGKDLGQRLSAAGLSVRQVTVHTEGSRLIDDAGRTLAWRDRYGRILTSAYEAPAGPALRVGLAGTPEQMLQTCPAPLAALGDALESAGLGADLCFLDPTNLPDAPLDRLDGVLMPGGADMAPVEGQIRLADLARVEGVPMLGLCLGMQSMATAAARRLPGWQGASLAEARPTAPCFSFQPFPDGMHRLGPRRIEAQPGSYLSTLLDRPVEVMANHRYRLASELLDALPEVGLHASSVEPCGTAAAIEGAGFYLGLQGHPELSSTRQHPNPVFSAFVKAMQDHSGTATGPDKASGSPILQG
ncbi:hypothetical protein P775_12965 [Puniceibacterium antarcticum]|uniref:CTP synthase (glutamine hydrolyzing) n=1 Tax=Puniceibacterium antarcticum TaxID=1206336 RepID=A0A2G8RDU3_9RHOB|nr:gamma-glutamyl-gamma-aminobutyrate hydrolase family protein [Puniceibacterium antarcticum]PIL19756.1 hypothetical protein P775_12965 [Puniceibacterium antarcticum]